MITREMIAAHDAACEAGKARWGEGPWTAEPNRVEFVHAGLHCLLLRNQHLGQWCGYAGVPKGHPAFGKNCDDVDVAVHWGLTYGEGCRDNICHMTDGPDEIFWFGFDCAHCGDLTPSIAAARAPGGPLEAIARHYGPSDETYKDVAFTRRQTERLAEQLAAMINPLEGT